VSDSLRPLADAMFASAADVLGTLAGRTITAGVSVEAEGDSSIRVEPNTVATLTRIPSAGLSFVARYAKADLARVVELMLGTPGDGGEMDAMQLSIVAETVAQISSAMGEALASATGHDANGIASEVVNEAHAFPAPPFATFTAALDLGADLRTPLTLDFDVLAQHRLVPEAPAQPAPAAQAPAPFRTPARPARVEEGQPVAFSPMAPTPMRTAAPGHANLDLVHDVPLEISAVLGQTELSLREVVSMTTGSVFELDKLSTDPIDLYVNNILIARGEVVVVDDKFAVKISELNPVVDKV
jgi:flagellar motor switch protein FliN/FliY